MARIQLSGLLTDIKGSIGGSTFQNNASGLIMRNKSGTPKALRLKQSFPRLFPNAFNKLWHSLTLASQLCLLLAV